MPNIAYIDIRRRSEIASAFKVDAKTVSAGQTLVTACHISADTAYMKTLIDEFSE